MRKITRPIALALSISITSALIFLFLNDDKSPKTEAENQSAAALLSDKNQDPREIINREDLDIKNKGRLPGVAVKLCFANLQSTLNPMLIGFEYTWCTFVSLPILTSNLNVAKALSSRPWTNCVLSISEKTILPLLDF